MTNYVIKYHLFLILSLTLSLNSVLATDAILSLATPTTSYPKITRLDWSNLTQPSVWHITRQTPVTDQPFFIEYDLEIPDLGNNESQTWYLWGYSFDPNWSSKARWRLDNEDDIDWTPEPAALVKVHNKAFAMHWTKWSTLELTPGKHSLRLEITDIRKQNDYHYFVMDTLILTTDKNYRPTSTLSLQNQVNDHLAALEALITKHPQGENYQQDLIQARQLSKNINTDPTAYFTFDTLYHQLQQLTSTLSIDTGDKQLYHNKIENFVLDKDTNDISFTVQWNRPWRGRYWLGFCQQQALYASQVGVVDNLLDKHDITVKLPDNLPVGRISLQCIPLDSAWGYSRPVNFILTQGSKNPRPHAWGIYRDKFRLAYPWQVNSNNQLYWAGKPYIPFGGMMNTRASWQTNIGTIDNHSATAVKLLREHFTLLKKYGIDDIYFNGMFLRSNPESLRKVVALTEEMGMTYGLELTSVPQFSGQGFVYYPSNQIKLTAGATSVTINSNTAGSENRQKKDLTAAERYIALPQHRCAWLLIDQQNQPLDCGITEFTIIPNPQGQQYPQQLVAEIQFKQSLPTDATLQFWPEVTLHRNDPLGYLEGQEEYKQSIRLIYGSLPLGSGLRFFIDPYQNEMHYPPRNTPTGDEFRRRYGIWLMDKYKSIPELNTSWGTVSQSENKLDDFVTASSLLPLWTDNTGSTLWIQPESQVSYRFSSKSDAILRDFKEFRGQLVSELISEVSDLLKEIADVPVIIKHNTWFSDWLINQQKRGGFDAVAYESYCYGDSLAYHNTVTPYAQALQSAREQWIIVGESSAAAFEGQKDYPGYPDRLQMINDIDYLMYLGAKGFYHFGFSFDPDGGRYFTTELTRDPRQLEWLSTLRQVYLQAADKLGTYSPQVYGWYPGYLREQEIVGGAVPEYTIDGNYMAKPTQNRMLPDGDWLVPAIIPDAKWKGLFVDTRRLTPRQERELAQFTPDFPIYYLRDSTNASSNNFPVNSFTIQGIGIIDPVPNNPDQLAAFRRDILGTATFQTRDANGYKLPNGDILLWTEWQKKSSITKLPDNVKVYAIDGSELIVTDNTLTLTYGNRAKLTDKQPPHLPNGYHYLDDGQPEACRIVGTTPEALMALNLPAQLRYYPAELKTESVINFVEAEDFVRNSFNQPSILGYSQYSGRAVGLNTHFSAPEGEYYQVEYSVNVPQTITQGKFYLRRMASPAVDLQVWIAGQLKGTISRQAEMSDSWHLSPWDAGLSVNNLKVGWVNCDIGAIDTGVKEIIIRAVGAGVEYDSDTKLLGGAAEAEIGSRYKKTVIQATQIDCFALVESAVTE